MLKPRLGIAFSLLVAALCGLCGTASAAESLELTAKTPEHIAGSYSRDGVKITFDANRIGERQMIFDLGDGAQNLLHAEVDRVSYTMNVLGTVYAGELAPDGDPDHESPPVVTGPDNAVERFRDTPQYKLLPHLSRALGVKGFTGRSHPASMAIHVFALASAKAHKTRLELMPAPVLKAPNSSDPRLHGSGGDRFPSEPVPQCFDQQGDPCNDDCFGMCGADCTCWTWVCGDCCVYGTCLKHDTYCSKCECGKGGQYCVLCYVPITVIFSTCKWQTDPCPDLAACAAPPTSGAPTKPGGQPVPGSALTSWSQGQSVRVYYLDSDYHVVQLWWNNTIWQSWDLTDSAKAPPAVPGSSLTSYVDAVFYLNDSQHVMELWWNDGNSTWNIWDLTVISGAQPAAAGSKLSSYSDRVFYLGSNNHVMELWWNGSSWANWDLTSMSGSPAAAAGSAITSYEDRVFYLDGSNNVIELWWNDGNNTWNYWNLTTMFNAPAAAAGSSLDSTPNFVAYLSSNQHLILFSSTGSSWTFQDLTAATNAPAARAGSPITGLNRVFYYLDANGHLISLNSANTTSTDLTAAANAPLADDQTSLTATTDANGNPLIFYTTRSRHLFEIWNNGSAWVYVDLTPGPVSDG